MVKLGALEFLNFLKLNGVMLKLYRFFLFLKDTLIEYVWFKIVKIGCCTHSYISTD